MSEFRVSSRYAKALMELAEEKNLFEEISRDAELIFNTLNESKELKRVLGSPVIKDSKKNDILEEIFRNKISAETMNYLNFIIKKNRVKSIQDIFSYFMDLHDDKTGTAKAHVISAFSMEDAQKEFIKAKFEDCTKKKLKINFSVDKEIIGGFTVKIGDEVFDASVMHQLDILRDKFSKEAYSLN